MLKTLNVKDISSDSFYFLSNHDALVHMCKVASGIDSQVLGEQEILGQFKKSIQAHIKLGSLKGSFQRLTDKIISIAKAARTETQIGFNPLSVSGLSLKIVQEIFEDPINQNLTIVGAGQMAMSVIENFYNKLVKLSNSNDDIKQGKKLIKDYKMMIWSSLKNLLKLY